MLCGFRWSGRPTHRALLVLADGRHGARAVCLVRGRRHCLRTMQCGFGWTVRSGVDGTNHDPCLLGSEQMALLAYLILRVQVGGQYGSSWSGLPVLHNLLVQADEPSIARWMALPVLCALQVRADGRSSLGQMAMLRTLSCGFGQTNSPVQGGWYCPHTMLCRSGWMDGLVQGEGHCLTHHAVQFGRTDVRFGADGMVATAAHCAV